MLDQESRVYCNGVCKGLPWLEAQMNLWVFVVGIIVGCCRGQAMLLQRQCTHLTVDHDDSLPAKAVYLTITDEGPFMCWGLGYLYDRLQKLGESRKLFKWCQFFQQTVTQTGLVGDNFPCVIHIRGHGLPPEALDESVASSEAVLTYFYAVLNVGRKPEITREVDLWIWKIINRVCEESNSQTVDVALVDLGVLQFWPRQSVVTGLQQIVMTRHRTAFDSWMKLWGSMKEAGELASSWTVDVGQDLQLRDVIMFAFKANRTRKSQGKTAWVKAAPSGEVLLELQRAVIRFLSEGLYMYINFKYQLSHDVTKAAPARRTSTGSNRTSMPVQNIWTVLDHAQATGKNVRQALQFCKSTLSEAGGCHENAAEAWMRRKQIIYDQRVSASLIEAKHFNVVADTSKHSGREVLVSVIWSHENQTAAIPSVQSILPCDTLVSPGELDLTTLVEKLAKDLLPGWLTD